MSRIFSLWKGETLAKMQTVLSLFSNSLSESLSISSPKMIPSLFNPILSEIALAVRGLSPVIIITRIPAV